MAESLNGTPCVGSQWNKIDGMITAVFTPMNADESLNLSLIERYVEHLQNNGVKGVFVNGTSGESMSLTVEERKVLAEAWVFHSRNKLKVIVHCGAGNLAESKQLASHAERIGVDAIGAMVPSFFKANSVEAVVNYLKQVASAAPSTPFLYYHFPGMNGVHVDFEKVLKLGIDAISSLIGAKFTAYELDQAMGAASLNDRKLEIFAGYDSIHLAGFAVGVKSSISGATNFLGRERLRMVDAFNCGRMDDALAIQLRIKYFCDIITSNGTRHFISSYKQVFQLFEMDFGPARSPNPQVDAESGKKMLDELVANKFMNYTK